MTSFDTDTNGDTLREFIEFIGVSGSGVSNPTSVQAGTAEDTGTNYEANGLGTGNGIADDSIYKASAQFPNPGLVKFAIGARQGATACNGACERLSAYSFRITDSVFLNPIVDGYKSVKLTDADGNNVVSAGDSLTYTVTYINTGNAAVSNFQITDALPTGLTATAGAQTVTGATKNGAYTGTGANTGLLATGQTLAVNGTITVTISVTVGTVAADNTVLSNQTTTSGNYTNALGGSVTLPSVSSDNVDNTTVFPSSVTAATGFTAVPAGSIAQTQASSIDPTKVTVRLTRAISGNVYEDYNYGGGAGRAYALASGMSLRPSVRVELYSNVGAYLTSTLTNASGAYTFVGQLPGTYKVRVVNSFVTSSRAGACAVAVNDLTPPAGCTQLPVQTYINGASQVGGANPTGTDPALSTGTLPVGAQSVASVTVGSSNVANVDFGYNFSTVVNTGDAATPGQGSLRQFIVNANALANNTLAQSGNRGAVVTGASQTLPSARDTSIFMIPSGALTGGVAIITSTGSVMPAITRSNVSIDGTTQSVNVGNTNTGVLGAGGTVGYLNTATLDMVQKPEVQLVGTSALLVGLDLQANDLQVRGMSVYGFGNQANQNNHANIRIGNNFTGSLIEANILGSPASSFGCGASTTAALSNADNIRSVGGDGGTVRNNLIGCAAGKGFGVEGGSENWTITNNEIRGNGIGNTNLDGIDLENSGSKNHTVSGNLITENSGVGVDGYQGSGGNTIERNTITGNGIGQGGAPGETSGIRIYSSNNAVRNNVIAQNYGAGILVVSGHTGNLISQNSMYDNGTIAAANGAAASNQIGIDLSAAGDSASAGTAPYVTRNDSGDGDTGGNDLLNFPVFETAQIVSGKLQLSGFARPGSAIELFIAAADASGFGEGRTYLVTLIEGSAADTDGGTGTYTDTLTGTDTTNRFRFSVPLPNGVTVGTRLTATATCSAASCPGTTVSVSSETSEFSYNVVVTAQPPSISLLKLGRNTAGGPFTDSSTLIGVRPGESVEYCVIYSNAGGEATNFVLRDYVPSGLVPQLSAYGTRGGGQALGLKYAPGVALTAGAADSAAVMPTLTSVSDGDEGALSNVPVTNPGDPVGSPQRPGLMTLTLPSVPAGGQGTVCFQARVP